MGTVDKEYNRNRLAKLNGIDPDSKAWARWCDQIGADAVEKAIVRASRGTNLAPRQPSKNGACAPRRCKRGLHFQILQRADRFFRAILRFFSEFR
jgi:hypothetical protein